MEFWDYNEHNIDGKGRLVLPSSFRSAFEDGGVLTFQGNYVALHEPSAWDQALRRMQNSGEYTKLELNYVKSLVTTFTPDAQNRVMIPIRLRERVGLDREVALIGMGNHIALYPRDVWREIEAELDRAVDGRPSLSDRLAEVL